MKRGPGDERFGRLNSIHRHGKRICGVEDQPHVEVLFRQAKTLELEVHVELVGVTTERSTSGKIIYI